jgi:hypothetical protein
MKLSPLSRMKSLIPFQPNSRAAVRMIYFWYTVGRGPFSSVSRSQIMPSRE